MVYPYPIAKNVGKWGSGKGFGESKKSVVYKYFHDFSQVFHANSHLAITRNKKDDGSIFERINHTMMNSFGYGWEQEAKWHVALAYSRIGVVKKYSNPSPIVSILCWIIMKQLHITAKLIKLLQ